MTGRKNVELVGKTLIGVATLVLLGSAEMTIAAAALAPLAAADSNYVHFLSPSRNISCEIDYQRGAGIPDGAYCQTDSPPESVKMDASGLPVVCRGINCLGDAQQGTPALAYGQIVGAGPFTCLSEVSGVTCTVVSGRGFTISSSGITPVG